LNSTALELKERAFALGSKRGLGSNDLRNHYGRGEWFKNDTERRQLKKEKKAGQSREKGVM
jgi:hypothetical protein